MRGEGATCPNLGSVVGFGRNNLALMRAFYSGRRNIFAYVDTSALIAFLDKSDTYHPVFRRLFADPPSLVTTALVLAEGHGWFLRRFD